MVDGRLTVLVYGTRTAPAADGETRQTFGGNRRSVWSGATPRRRRITALFTYYCEGNCYGVVVVGRFSPDLVDERPPVDARAGTNATIRMIGANDWVSGSCGGARALRRGIFHGFHVSKFPSTCQACQPPLSTSSSTWTSHLTTYLTSATHDFPFT